MSSRTVLVFVMMGVLSACGGQVVHEPEEPDAASLCGDGVTNAPEEECDDGNTDRADLCVDCKYVKSDECGVMGSCSDGRTSYRCTGPVGVPVTLEGSAVTGCSDEGTDPQGGHLYCCAPACVRFSTGDRNCSSTGGKWLLCPAGSDDRSAIGVPAGCEFKGRTGEAAGFCCE